MSTVFCCILVVLVSVALCVDFEERPRRFSREQPMFRKSHKSRNLLSLRDLQQPDHVRMKRSEESAQNQCESLHGFDSTLKNNTHTVSQNIFYSLYSYHSSE